MLAVPLSLGATSTDISCPTSCPASSQAGRGGTRLGVAWQMAR